MEVEDDLPLRWYVIAAYMVVVAAGFALAVWCTVAWFSRCDEGRHTSPYVAGDSLRGTLCDSGHGVAGVLVAAGWLVGLGLATVALARWGGGRARALLLTALFVTPVVLPAAAYAALGLSGTDCTGDKERSYLDWVDGGNKGPAPYDCRKY
jgi:hypothetical protein